MKRRKGPVVRPGKWRVQKYRRVYDWPWAMPWVVICPWTKCAWEAETWQHAMDKVSRLARGGHDCLW